MNELTIQDMLGNVPATKIITIKLRLKDKHSKELLRQARAVNAVWNYLNETSNKAYQRDHKRLSRFDFQKLTAGSSKLLGLNSHTIQRVCHYYSVNRDRAKKARIRWRTDKSLGWIPFNQNHVKYNGEDLRFNGKVFVPMHHNVKLPSYTKIHAGSFNADNRGRWYANLSIEIECERNRSHNAVGIDLGLSTLAAMSTGGKISMPAFYRKSEGVIIAAKIAGKTKKHKAIHRKVANRRKDFLHKASTALAKEYGLIVVGDVSPSKLAQTRMAKSVLDAGWSDFKRMLSYKALMHGGRMIEVSERMTTQTCSYCGALPEGRPKGIAGLGIREWSCDECGTVHDRDVNAAKNILRLGLETLAEGAA